MYVINEQLDSSAFLGINICARFPPLLHKFLVELDEQQYLVPHRCEQVVFPYQVENIGSPEAKIER